MLLRPGGVFRMLAFLLAAGLFLLAVAGLMRGVSAGGRLILIGFDGIGVLAGFIVTIVAARRDIGFGDAAP